MHDAFLQLWRNARHFNPLRGTADAWLLSLARYRALDIARCRAHEVPGDALPEPVDNSRDPFARLADRNDAVALHVSLDCLKPDRRRLVLLVFVEGLTYAQAAERMQMPIGTAKNSIRRSLRALRRNLEDAAGRGGVAKADHQAHAWPAPLSERMPRSTLPQ